MALNNDWRSLVADFDEGKTRADFDAATSLAAVVIGKANVKLLNSLGHVFGRYMEAQKGLLKRGVKEAPALEAWLSGAPELGELPKEFRLVVRVSAGGVRWLGVVGEGLEPWNAAIWPALLRLPALRSFWEQQLRGSVLETLRQVMPKAWVVDPTPLPPGSVVAGLEIADWKQVSEVEGRYAVSSRWREAEEFKDASELDVLAALAAFPADGKILTKALDDGEASEVWTVLASYQVDEKGTSLVKAKALSRVDGVVAVAAVTGK